MSDKPKVVGLHGQVVTDGRTPRPEVVKAARELLEMAESGEIVGFAAAYTFYDDATGARGEGVLGYAAIGRLEQWKARILRSLEN